MSENEITTIGTSEVEVIKHRIYEVRGLRVMLDRDLAELYGVETKVLNQAVKRNIERFPEDFMFKLNKSEWAFLRSQIVTLKQSTTGADTEEIDVIETSLRSQIVTLNDVKYDLKSQTVISNGRGQHSKYLPYAFTELGIAMLSSVLRSETAIQVNINIMRAFVAIRHAVSAWQGVNLKVEQLSHKVDQLNNYVEEILHDQNDINRMQDETNNEIALQIEAINDALDQLCEKSSTPRKRIGYKQQKEDSSDGNKKD
ncbi:MAG: ORF6N domain-containing protein [Bacteroidales bacterium]|nr:ORF6N domain-containing protein [Bacteroidales bacterium]